MIHKPPHGALPISARGMTNSEEDYKVRLLFRELSENISSIARRARLC